MTKKPALKMGTIESVADWGSQLFRPSNSTYPVQVFISILEHKAKGRGLSTDADLIDFAVTQLDTTEIKEAKIKLFSQQASWENFKSVLLLAYNKEPLFEEKVDLFKSLAKGPNEDCYHYLIRIRYAASLIKESVSCQCDKASVDVDELAKILFMAGIESYEQNLCR